MKKLFVCALLFGLLASVPAFAQKTYVNGIDSNYPPFAYVDEKTGQPAGFDVDAMNWIAKTMGFKVVHKPVAWDGIVLALANKQIDMIASGMSITEKRRKVVDFSDPYWEVSRVFLVPADSKLTPADSPSSWACSAAPPKLKPSSRNRRKRAIPLSCASMNPVLWPWKTWSTAVSKPPSWTPCPPVTPSPAARP